MTSRKTPYRDSVFINCPFDDEYVPIFRAIVFTVAAFAGSCRGAPWSMTTQARCGLKKFTASSAPRHWEFTMFPVRNPMPKTNCRVSICRWSLESFSAQNDLAPESTGRNDALFWIGTGIGFKNSFPTSPARTSSRMATTPKPRFGPYVIGSATLSVTPAFRADRISGRTTSNSQRGLGGMCGKVQLTPEHLTFTDFYQFVLEWISPDPLRLRVSTRYLPVRVTSSRTRIRRAVVSRKPDARSGAGFLAGVRDGSHGRI